MEKRYIIALDQGTTSSRAVIFNSVSGKIECIRSRQLTQHYPKPAWVEHDPEEIWSTQLDSLKEAISASGIEPADVACIGITNQRETVVVWDRLTGRPVCNAVVWQCRRTADICNSLKAGGYDDLIRQKNEPCHGCIFFRIKAQMDIGQYRRCA